MKRSRLKAFDRIAAKAWAEAPPWPDACQVCGDWRNPVVAHHVLYQQWLRSVAATRGLDYERIRWDARGRLWCCVACHEAHHNGSRRIPMGVLHDHCPEVFDMAYELGLDWRLDKTYPVSIEEAA